MPIGRRTATGVFRTKRPQAPTYGRRNARHGRTLLRSHERSPERDDTGHLATAGQIGGGRCCYMVMQPWHDCQSGLRKRRACAGRPAWRRAQPKRNRSACPSLEQDTELGQAKEWPALQSRESSSRHAEQAHHAGRRLKQGPLPTRGGRSTVFVTLAGAAIFPSLDRLGVGNFNPGRPIAARTAPFPSGSTL